MHPHMLTFIPHHSSCLCISAELLACIMPKIETNVADLAGTLSDSRIEAAALQSAITSCMCWWRAHSCLHLSHAAVPAARRGEYCCTVYLMKAFNPRGLPDQGQASRMESTTVGLTAKDYRRSKHHCVPFQQMCELGDVPAVVAGLKFRCTDTPIFPSARPAKRGAWQ